MLRLSVGWSNHQTDDLWRILRRAAFACAALKVTNPADERIPEFEAEVRNIRAELDQRKREQESFLR